MEGYIEYLGLLAGFCTTSSFLPQIIKIVQTRAVHDISKLMYLMFITGLILWVIYGLYRHSWPLVITNSVTLVFACSILIMKILWDKE